MRDADPAQYQRTAGYETMHVKPQTRGRKDRVRLCRTCPLPLGTSPTRVSKILRSPGVVSFRLRSDPQTTATGSPSASTKAQSSGSLQLGPLSVRPLQKLSGKGLRRLHRPKARAIQRAHHQPVGSHLFDGLFHRQRNRSGTGRSRSALAPARTGPHRPGSYPVVNDDPSPPL